VDRHPCRKWRGGHRNHPMKTLLQRAPVCAIAAAAAFLAGCESYPAPNVGVPFPAAPVPAFVAVQAAPMEALDPALLGPGETAFHLGPGDQLDIEVLGDPAMRESVTVGPDGKIYYYLLSGLDVWGPDDSRSARPPQRRAGQVHPRETRHFDRSATVASQRVWVLGRVNSPGIYILSGPTTLLDAVSQAGGLSSSSPFASLAASLGVARPTDSATEAADLSRSFVIRQGRVLPVDFQQLLRDGALSQNIYLQPDDFVFLPSLRSAQIHVLGAVVLPQAERMNGSLTVVQAIALAGGTEPKACLSSVADPARRARPSADRARERGGDPAWSRPRRPPRSERHRFRALCARAYAAPLCRPRPRHLRPHGRRQCRRPRHLRQSHSVGIGVNVSP